VELLVLTFYEFAERQRLEALNAGNSHNEEQHSEDHASNNGPKKVPPKISSLHVQEEKKYIDTEQNSA